MTSIAVAKGLVDSMERTLDELLVRPDQLCAPEVREELKRQAEQAESNTEQIEEWGGEAVATADRRPPSVNKKWYALRAKAELLERRTRLCSPRSEQEFASTLLWEAERGELEDLALLGVIKTDPPFRSEYTGKLLDTAERRIRERYDNLFLELRTFFDMSEDEFARLPGVADAPRSVSAARRAQETVEELSQLKELLRGQVGPREIERWLRTPNAELGGAPPVHLIASGETDRVSRILIRLAEGIHY